MFKALRSGEKGNDGSPVPARIWREQASRLREPIGCEDAAPPWIDMVIEDTSNV